MKSFLSPPPNRTVWPAPRPAQPVFGAPLLVLVLSLLAGCSGGDGSANGRVPFKQAPPGTIDEPTEPTAAPEATTEPDFVAATARIFPAGTSHAEIGGARIVLPAGELRAALSVDLDGDGDHDVLAWTVVPGASGTLLYAHRDHQRFGRFHAITQVKITDECRFEGPSIRTLSREWGLGHITLACPGASTTYQSAFSLEARPRRKEQFRLLPPSGGAAASVAIHIVTSSHHNDSFENLVVEATVTPRGGQATTVAIPFLNLPGGLTPDPDEPKDTIERLATRARRLLEGNVLEARRLGQQALAVYDALCHEGGRPRLHVGTRGLRCNATEAVTRANAVVAAAIAGVGSISAALPYAERATAGGSARHPQDQPLVDRAFAHAPTTLRPRLTRIGDYRPSQRATVGLPAIAFLADGSLLIRGDSPTLLDPATRTQSPATGPHTETMVRDPKHRFVVTGMQRRCDGFHLIIARTAEVVAGLPVGPPVSEPLIKPDSALPGCPEMPPRAIDSGWVILGWAPQGIVASHLGVPWIAPLTVDAQPAGPPSALNDSSLPSPLPTTISTRAGSAFVQPSRYGILLHRTDAPSRTILLRPDDWLEHRIQPTDAAISSDGQRIALLSSGGVWLLDRM